MRPDILIKLVGPSGNNEPWRIRFKAMPKGDYGHTDWARRIVTINSRLRNQATIEGTILHEMGHVTAGQNASEEFMENFELNFRRAKNAMDIK